MDNIYEDYLTGSYKRKWLFEKCLSEMKSTDYTALYMDLDNFKTANDLYGHEEGDRVLKYFSDTLKSVCPEGYPVRMSGDEFVLIIDRPVTQEEIGVIYKRTEQAVKEGVKEIPSRSCISISAGAATACEGIGLQQTLNQADDAMYRAKRGGKARCVFYEDISREILKEKRIESLLNSHIQLKLITQLRLNSALKN